MLIKEPTLYCVKRSASKPQWSVLVQHTGEQNPPLRAKWKFNFHLINTRISEESDRPNLQGGVSRNAIQRPLVFSLQWGVILVVRSSFNLLKPTG